MGDLSPSGLEALLQERTISLHIAPTTSNAIRANGHQSSGQGAGDVQVKSPTTYSNLGSLNSHRSGAEAQGCDSEDDAESRSDEEETGRLVLNEPPKSRKISQKKKMEQMNFSQYISDNKARLSRDAANLPRVEDQSIAYMVKHWEGGEKIIHSPREYQLELFERAKNQNTIAVLDTGKSVIASDRITHEPRLTTTVMKDLARR